jgi:hypothetical protein
MNLLIMQTTTFTLKRPLAQGSSTHHQPSCGWMTPSIKVVELLLVFFFESKLDCRHHTPLL